jgi:hypothetical protein
LTVSQQSDTIKLSQALKEIANEIIDLKITREFVCFMLAKLKTDKQGK